MAIFERKSPADPVACFLFAFIFAGIAVWGYFAQSRITQELRLKQPVSTLAKFYEARCSAKISRNQMIVTHTFAVLQATGKTVSFKVTEPIGYASFEACELDIPRAPIAYASRYIWYEKDNPSVSRLDIVEAKSALPGPIVMLIISAIFIAFGLVGIERNATHKKQKTKRR